MNRSLFRWNQTSVNHTRRASIFILLLLSVISLTQLNAKENIVLQCATFRYEIDSQGKNVCFVDKQDDQDYLKRESGTETFCAAVKKGEKTFFPTSVTFADGVLSIEFQDGTNALIKVLDQKDRLVFEVIQTKGDFDSLQFLNIPLTLDAITVETFAACALSLNLQTEVFDLPALQRRLQANCYTRFGINGARVAVVGVPQNRILATIRDIMKKAAPEIPFSDQGGAWALDSKEGHGSYLVYGPLNEDSVDEGIKTCRAFGFHQVDHHGGKSFYFGSLEPDRDLFPEGWKSYKKVIDRLHENGISSILHTYSAYISPKTKYVTPVPSPDLDILKSFTLAAPLSEQADEIVVQEPIDPVYLETGWTIKSNRTLRIGDEIIQFNEITQEAPYRFTKCKRGFHGTKVARHDKNASVGLLKTFWSGLYIPRPDSPLFIEIAKNHADVVNNCGFDGIYFDAIEGYREMWGADNYWYYGSKFVFEVMKYLKKPVGVEYAGMTHHWWHYRSRYQAWDSVLRGYKRFLDIHLAAMKSGQELQHGAWTGYSPDINKYGSLEGGGIYLPLQLGWWSFIHSGTPTKETMFKDDIEYIGCKLIGNNAGFSLSASRLAKEHLDAHPIFYDFITIIKQYEELRVANYFSDSIRRQLRIPGKEFRLFNDGDQWYFKPVFYAKQKVDRTDPLSTTWNVNNEYGDQSPFLRIEALHELTTPDAPSTLTIFRPEKDKMEFDRAEKGVTASTCTGNENVPVTKESTIELSAISESDAPRAEVWSKWNRNYETPLKLGNRLGLGVWVRGDGNGEVLDLRLYTQPGFSACQSSHLIKIDFTGWRYFTLLELESARMSDYKWPRTGHYHVYDLYTGSAEANDIRELQIWFNNIPKGKKCEVALGPIHALNSQPGTWQDPTIILNGQKVTFPVTMTTGMYLECDSAKRCKLFSADGRCLKEFQLEVSLPLLKNGSNTLSFECQEKSTPRARVNVTISAEGTRLQ